MPDYTVIKNLCEELEITIAELMDGEEAAEKSVPLYDDEQIMDLLRRTQELEKQKTLLYEILLIVMGIALQALSHTFGGSNIKDIFSHCCEDKRGMEFFLNFLFCYVKALPQWRAQIRVKRK